MRARHRPAPAGPRRLAGAAAVLALVGLAAAAAPPPTPPARFALLHLGGEEPHSTALLTQPPGWWAGDAVAVLAGPPEPALVAAFLAAGAAVVELADAPTDRPEAALARAWEAAAGQLGSRLIVAVGGGGGGWGQAALAARHVGYAAAAALEGDGAVVRPGPAPPESERWDLRGPLFCAVLGEADFRWGRACDAALAPSPPKLVAGAR